MSCIMYMIGMLALGLLGGVVIGILVYKLMRGE